MHSHALKAAIMGCGKIGWSFQDDPGAGRFGVCTHAAAWTAMAGVELVAVGDSLISSAERCARRWSVPSFHQDLGALLESCSPDIVSIATPDERHFEDIKLCLACPSVRAVLAEKPLAETPAEAMELEAMAHRLGKVIVVNYSRRFCDFYITLRNRIQAGEFGALRLARNVYTKGVLHNGSHFVDLMHFFFGPLRPQSVSKPAWCQAAADGDPGLDLLLASAEGATVVMNHLPSSQFTVFEMDFCFERARFVFTEGGNTVREFGLVKDLPFAGYTSLEEIAVHRNVMRDYLLRATENVVAVLMNDAPNLSPASESVALLQEFGQVAALVS